MSATSDLAIPCPEHAGHCADISNGEPCLGCDRRVLGSDYCCRFCRARARRRGVPLRDDQPIRFVARIPKNAAKCCLATRDELGRMNIGYCSPECLRRPR